MKNAKLPTLRDMIANENTERCNAWNIAKTDIKMHEIDAKYNLKKPFRNFTDCYRSIGVLYGISQSDTEEGRRCVNMFVPPFTKSLGYWIAPLFGVKLAGEPTANT